MEEKGNNSRILLYMIIGFLIAVIIFIGGGKLIEIIPFGIAKFEFPTETPSVNPTENISSTAITEVKPNSTPTLQPNKPSNQITATSVVSGKYPCPLLINQSEVDKWKIGQTTVADVDKAVIEFDDLRLYNAGAFKKGTEIPSGILVAMNFDVIDGNAWSRYPLTPLIHSGSWGLFQTTGIFTAPNDGACMTIVP